LLRLKIIVNCGPSERFVGGCIRSIRSQNWPIWKAFVTVDPWPGKTYQNALEAAGSDPRIVVRRNAGRLHAAENLIRAVKRSNAQPEDVIVVLDGDDWFRSDRALRIIVDTYTKHDCWMTYGSWISNTRLTAGRWPAYPTDTLNFRQGRWLGTAVRTWKKWLFDELHDEDLRDESGAYIRGAEDKAMQFPALEMCGTAKARHIPDILMVYNRRQARPAGKILARDQFRNDAFLRMKPPYPRLEGKPCSSCTYSVS
jgi:hypothetical protein